MRPRVARIFDASWMAWPKSPVISVSAATKRLPKLCPSSASPARKRWAKSRASTSSSSLRATMQLRRSPGGSILKSLRSRPEDPPSSVTVTTAARSAIRPASGAVWLEDATWRRNPRSRIERPVPPPIATTRSAPAASPGAMAWGTGSEPNFGVVAEVTCPLGYLRIQQFRKPRVIRHVLEVIVRAGQEPVFGIQLDGLAQVTEAVLSASCNGVQQGQPVKSVIGLRMGLQNSAELLARFLIVARIQLRDGVIVMLLGRQEIQVMLFHLPLTGADVHLASFHQLGRRDGKKFLESAHRLVESALLNQLHGSLIVLVGRSRTRSGMGTGL